MTEPVLLSEDIGPVRVLTVNRPKALNALNAPLIQELHESFKEIEQSESVRAVVLTGAGDRAFVAGADITELESMTPAEAVPYSERGQELMHFIESMRLPVIAAVNGFALGGGLELALACDFIFAAEAASFGLVEAQLGLIPGYGGVGRLAHRIGEAASREALFTARRYDAQESLRLGLVNRVVAKEDLIPVTLEVARSIASKSPASIQSLRSLFQATRSCDQQTKSALETKAFAQIFADADAHEGIAAFLQKRKPNFGRSESKDEA